MYDTGDAQDLLQSLSKVRSRYQCVGNNDKETTGGLTQKIPNVSLITSAATTIL